MRVVIASDSAGEALKAQLKDYLVQEGHEVDDKSAPGMDCVDAALAVAYDLVDRPHCLGIVVDAYGVGSFMAACKVKGMVAAEISDERSAYMTRQHNNARMICLGSEVVGPTLAKRIASEFLAASYDGGRHQIRVDMLNRMA